jgi:hypothetical protein
MNRAYWSIADNNNLPFYKQLQNSFKKFHKEDLILFGENEIKATRDPMIFYRANPYFNNKLFEAGYTEVCKIDADSIVFNNLDHIWEGDFDVGVVNNSNPREFKSYPVTVWDIHPLSYVNCGLVVVKNKKFNDHWLRLCMSDHFNNYQFREQDLLNIMVHYMDYRVKFLDKSNKWHGLVSKQYTAQFATIDQANRLILAKNEEWPNDEAKEVVVYHFAGGNDPNKGNYRLAFSPDICRRIEYLIKDGT